MQTIETYKLKQNQMVNLLTRLLKFIQEGQQYGIKHNPKIIDKINEAIHKVESGELKVAFIGGFSEGKTSIISAWTEHYDQQTMKISQSESSDTINIYETNEGYKLIDTPGLFGFKETVDHEKYKNITKKYVSESDIVIYVMNSSNPIKNSHKEELIWLFKDLNLISRTIFVLSRFDDVVDIEDEEEYIDTLNIRKKEIKTRLVDFGIITPNTEISIVAIAAKPFGNGFDYWLNNIEEYRKLSHIHELQEATSNKIQSFESKEQIMLEAQQSIIIDVLYNSIPVAEKKLAEASTEMEGLNKICLRAQKDLANLKAKITKTKGILSKYIVEYFTDLILQAEGTSLETINNFFEKKIGENGVVIEVDLKNKFEKEIGSINRDIEIFSNSLNTDIDHHNNVMSGLALTGIKAGGQYLKAGKIVIDNKQVLAIRDVVMPEFKFKPWGAIKLADKVNKTIPYIGAAIGIAVEAWDSYSKAKKEQEFQKVKNKMVEDLNEQRRNYLSIVDDSETFIDLFFENYREQENQLNQLMQEVKDCQQLKDNFEKWKNEGKEIEDDFAQILNYVS